MTAPRWCLLENDAVGSVSAPAADTACRPVASGVFLGSTVSGRNARVLAGAESVGRGGFPLPRSNPRVLADVPLEGDAAHPAASDLRSFSGEPPARDGAGENHQVVVQAVSCRRLPSRTRCVGFVQPASADAFRLASDATGASSAVGEPVGHTSPGAVGAGAARRRVRRSRSRSAEHRRRERVRLETSAKEADETRAAS